ncbi:hypothetical protein ACH5RR_032669 [Cinchona calisaya]|uniref:Uncharacterized protein n=1 Tax=Cinchona calisaya TaxID=153742 RepID=A0ABD2YN57_9GENT
MAYHLKPLFVQEHLNGVPVARKMVDISAVANMLPASMMKRLEKSTKDLILSDIMENKASMSKRCLGQVQHKESKPEDSKEEEKRRSTVHYANAIFEMEEELANYDAIDRLTIQPVDLEKDRVRAKYNVVKEDLGNG